MKNFLTIIAFICNFYGLKGQNFPNPEPATHDIRDIYVSFEIDAGKPDLKLSDYSVLHNTVFFKFPDFSTLPNWNNLLFFFGDGTSAPISPNQTITHVYPLNSTNAPVPFEIQLLYGDFDKVTFFLNQSNPIGSLTFTPPDFVKEFTPSFLVPAPIPNSFPAGSIYNSDLLGGATVYFKYAPSHNGRLLKPLIFVDGVDFDGRVSTWDGQIIRHGSTGWDIFQMGNDGGDPNLFDSDLPVYRNYPDALNLIGEPGHDYDILFIDFTRGSDWIQKNGEVVIEVIKWVNEEKNRNRQAGFCTFDNTVLGASMGGQVAKWALTTMENRGIPHETHTYVSFDSPQKGAHIPLSIQSFAYLAKEAGAQTELWKRLNDPAARQMLLLHLSAEFDAGNLTVLQFDDINCTLSSPEPPTFEFPNTAAIRSSFVNEMAQLGYPKYCRNVGVSCGTSSGVGQGFADGASLMNGGLVSPDYLCPTNAGNEYVFDAQLFAGNGAASATKMVQCLAVCSPYNGLPSTIFKGAIPDKFVMTTILGKTIKFPIGYKKVLVRNNGTVYPEFDNAPGCKRGDIMTVGQSIIDQVESPIVPEVTVFNNYTSFMPSISLLDISGPLNNLNLTKPFNTDLIVLNGETPFSAVWAPTGPSLRHIEMDPLITSFSLTQMGIGISNSLAAFQNFEIKPNNSFNYGRSKNRVPSVNIKSNGRLAVNIAGTINWMTPNDPIADLLHFDVYTGYACASATTINIERDGLLQIGDPTNPKTGNFHALSGAMVHVFSGGTLRVSKESSLHIYAGATLTLDQNAKIQLDDPESKIRIEGRLLINGDMDFSGLGYFEFANGGVIDFGNGATTFRLRGAAQNHRFIQIEDTQLNLPDSRHMMLEDGAVEFEGKGVLSIGAGCDVNFTRNDFYAEPGFLSSIEAKSSSGGMHDLNILECSFSGLDAPLNINGGSGKTYLFSTVFNRYIQGPIIENRGYVDLLNMNCSGNGWSKFGLRANQNFVTHLRDCSISGHKQSGFIPFTPANNREGIQIEGGWILWLQGTQIANNDIGISNRGELDLPHFPTNVIMQNNTTILNGFAGVSMLGDANVGLVLMDCSRLINLNQGIIGEDIRIQIDPLTLHDLYGIEPRANTFIRKNITSSRFIDVCYKTFRTPPNPTLGRGNYWGLSANTTNWNGTATAVSNPTLLQRVRLCLAPTSTSNCNCENTNSPQSIGFTYSPTRTLLPQDCINDPHFCDDPTGLTCSDDCDLNLPNVPNSSLMTVKNTFNTGLQQLNATNFTASQQSFVNVATRNGPNVPTYTSSCQSLIHASVSLSWTGLQPLQGGSGGDRNVEKTQPARGKITLAPNPTDGRFEVILGQSDICTVRIFDLFGKLVFEKTGKESLMIDAENWPTGIFTVLAMDAKGFVFAQQKLAIQR